NIEGSQLDGVLTAIPFLRASSQGESVKLGKRVLIIGGGAVAMDCARTALRMGCKRVHVSCLESRKEMPTTDYEIEEAIHEGAIIHTSLGPKRILGKDGKVTALETIVCKSVFDIQGRFNPTFVEGSESVIETDTIILAVGQASDPSFLQEQKDIQVTRGGTITVDPATLCTTVPGIFASGDVVLGRGTLTEAIGQGKKAALAIHDYLRGIKRKKEEEILPLQELSSIRLQLIKKQGRLRMPTLADEVRLNTYDEVELGFSTELAVKEAQRCMNCGAGAVVNQDICAGCLTCVRVCPYDVPKIAVGDSVAYIGCDCQSCGICVMECPAAAISFKAAYEDWGEAEFESAFKDAVEPLLLNFYCQYDAFPSNEVFGEFARNVKRVRFQCLAKVNPLIFLKAFEKGAKGVFVTVCPQDECRFNNTICWAEKRVKYARGLLEAVGIEGERLKLTNATPPSAEEFAQWANQVLKDIGAPCSAVQ
ncbi:MAG TPA: hydrogenase iron-sulfur subunit, partial [Candidatus Brocadiales bacterium]|nr:hydrogenase iron-sulfur subunit [Candidatus Brocadiales bacterium]